MTSSYVDARLRRMFTPLIGTFFLSMSHETAPPGLSAATERARLAPTARTVATFIFELARSRV